MKGIGQGDVILMDTVPLIRRILCPHIRSVSEHLMSRSEKSDLEHTVTVMADLGLNYSQVQLNEGKFKYQLEPDLEHISTFPDVARESLNYWTCQLVSREVQEEYIRRATPKMGQVNEGRKEIQMETETTKEVAHSETIEIEFEKPAEPSTNVLRSNKDFANVKEVVSSSWMDVGVGWDVVSGVLQSSRNLISVSDCNRKRLYIFKFLFIFGFFAIDPPSIIKLVFE